MHAMKLLKALVDYLLEEPNVEHISQPESPHLVQARATARHWLYTRSPKWRGKHETQSLQRSNHSSDEDNSRPVSL